MPPEAEHMSLLRRCLDGPAAAQDYDRAESLLRDNPALRAQLSEELGFEALLATALRNEDPAPFTQRIGRRIRLQGNSRCFASAMRRRIESERSRQVFRRSWTWAAAAALLVVAMSGLLLLPEPAQEAAPAMLHELRGSVSIARGERRLPVDGSLALRIGDLITVEARASARLTLADGSVAELRGPAHCLLSAAKELHLAAGQATLQVAAQASTRPVLVTTPHALVAVLGTRFTTSVAEETTIGVEEGQVQLIDRGNWLVRNIAAGDTASLPTTTLPVMNEHWQEVLFGKWQVVGADLAALPDGPDPVGFERRAGSLHLTGIEDRSLLSADGLPTSPGRYLLTTRFRHHGRAEDQPGLRIGLALTGASQRLDRGATPELPDFVPERWYRLAITVEIMPETGGRRRIDCHYAMAPADAATVFPQVVTQQLWRIGKTSAQNELHILINGRLGPTSIGPLRVERLPGDQL